MYFSLKRWLKNNSIFRQHTFAEFYVGVRNLIKERQKYLFRSGRGIEESHHSAGVLPLAFNFLLIEILVLTKPSSARLARYRTRRYAHFPPEGRGARSPDAGRGNLLQRRRSLFKRGNLLQRRRSLFKNEAHLRCIKRVA